MRARELTFCSAALGAFLRLRGRYLRLDPRQIFGALTLLLDALGLDARGLGSSGLLSGGRFRRGLRGGCVLLGSGLDVRGFSSPADWRFGGNDRNRRGLRSGVRASPTRRRDGRRRAFRACALFALPSRANASYLFVAEHAHMAANRDVHLPKQTDDLIGRNPEFVRQLANCELAQPSSSILLARGGLGATSSRTPAANCRSVIPTTAV
jgi:hypothetical protein